MSRSCALYSEELLYEALGARVSGDVLFDKDLLTAEKEGFSNNMPADVYFAGKKVN